MQKYVASNVSSVKLRNTSLRIGRVFFRTTQELVKCLLQLWTQGTDVWPMLRAKLAGYANGGQVSLLNGKHACTPKRI